MEFTLIRDNVPKICQKEKTNCDYAVAANNEFYARLLQQKLVDFANNFLVEVANKNGLLTTDKEFILTNFSELLAVLHSITKLCGISDEDLDKKYFADLEKYGLYNSRFIGFFEPQILSQSDQKVEAKEEK